MDSPPFIQRPAEPWTHARPVLAPARPRPEVAAPAKAPEADTLVARLHALHRDRARLGPRGNLTRDFGWAFATLAGISSRAIAKETGVDRSRVSRVVRELIRAAKGQGVAVG